MYFIDVENRNGIDWYAVFHYGKSNDKIQDTPWMNAFQPIKGACDYYNALYELCDSLLRYTGFYDLVNK